MNTERRTAAPDASTTRSAAPLNRIASLVGLFILLVSSRSARRRAGWKAFAPTKPQPILASIPKKSLNRRGPHSGRGHNFPRIENVQRVERSLDRAHDGNTRAVLGLQ